MILDFTEPEKCAERGFAVLERNRPGFWLDINLTTLDVLSCWYCPVGQTFKEEFARDMSLSRNFGDSPFNYGIAKLCDADSEFRDLLRDHGPGHFGFSGQSSNPAWRDLIARRRLQELRRSEQDQITEDALLEMEKYEQQIQRTAEHPMERSALG